MFCDKKNTRFFTLIIFIYKETDINSTKSLLDLHSCKNKYKSHYYKNESIHS